MSASGASGATSPAPAESPPPRRRVVKKRIAETIEKLVSEQSKNFEQKVKVDASEIASEINQVCFCRYSSEGGYQRCLDYKVELDRIHAKHDSSDAVSPTTEFMALMSVARPILRQALADPDLERKHSDIKRSEVEWLVHFIEMLLARKDVSSLEQNISITYFSCFRPLFQKLNSGETVVEEDDPFALYGSGGSGPMGSQGDSGYEWLFD